MTLRELVGAIAARAQQLEDESYVAAGPDGSLPLPAFVHVCRENALVAAVVCAGTADTLAQVSAICARMGGEAVAVTCETWTSALPTNPVTGQRWREEEFATVAADHAGIEEGWVSEALLTSVYGPPDRCLGVQRPFTRTPDGLQWQPPVPVEAADLVHAPLSQTIFAAFAEPTFREELVAGDPQGAALMPLEEQFLYADVGVCPRLNELASAVYLFAEPGSPRARALEEAGYVPAGHAGAPFDAFRFRFSQPRR